METLRSVEWMTSSSSLCVYIYVCPSWKKRKRDTVYSHVFFSVSQFVETPTVAQSEE